MNMSVLYLGGMENVNLSFKGSYHTFLHVRTLKLQTAGYFYDYQTLFTMTFKIFCFSGRRQLQLILCEHSHRS